MGKLWYLSPSDQTGNTGINGYGTEEAQMNALLDAITPHLDRCGVRYHRASRDLGIDYRPAESDALGADYYLALHSNAGGGGAAYGPIAFYYAAGKELAGALQASLIGTLDPNSHRSVKSGKGIYLLEKANCPAVLVECGFLSNEAEEAKLRSADHQKKLCCCIAATVTEFLTRRESTDIM